MKINEKHLKSSKTIYQLVWFDQTEGIQSIVFDLESDAKRYASDNITGQITITKIRTQKYTKK